MVLRFLVRRGGLVAVALAASAPFALLACEDSSSSGSSGTPVSPTGTVPTPTTTPTTSPTPDGGGTTGDAEGGTPGTIPDAQTLKLLNISGAAINACIRSQAPGAPDFTTPAYRAAGIPIGALSERVIVPGDGTRELKIIPAGATCADPGLFTQGNLFAGQASNVHLVYWYRGAGNGAIAGGEVEHLTATAGKESVYFYLLASQGQPSFVRDDGVGAPISLRAAKAGDVVLLDGNLVGKVVSNGVPDRPMKTLAGGTLSLVGLSDKTLLCDERAAAIDGLTDCAATLRAP